MQRNQVFQLLLFQLESYKFQKINFHPLPTSYYYKNY
ncbi:hypothetical protein X975_22947, partial [Stegodyphus mimosarum]